MDWKTKLSQAVTIDDYQSIKDLICENEAYQLITSSIVLTAYLSERKDNDQKFFDRGFCHFGCLFLTDMMSPFLRYVEINEFFERNKQDKTLLLGSLMKEGNIDVLLLLLDNGLSVNEKINGTAILSIACFYGKVDAIDILIERGADVNQLNELGKAPASFAVRTGQVQVLDRLINQGAYLNYTDLLGDSLWAVHFKSNPDLEIVTRLAEMRVPIEPGLIAAILRYGVFESYHSLIKQIIVVLRSLGCEEPIIDSITTPRLTKETVQSLLAN